MGQEVILSVVGRDRRGLVDALASAIAGHDGNWIGSSMARLGGEFAGIVQVDIPAARREAFLAALVALGEDGIDVTVRGDQGPQASAAGGPAAHLHLTGADHVGIVRDISHALALANVTIDQLHTQVFKGSMSGQDMFAAEADIVLPDDLDVATLRDALERIAGDLVVEIEPKGI